MKKHDGDVNKFYTKERFDAYYKWSKQDINREFNTALWDHINKSELDAIFRLLNDFGKKDYFALEAGCGSGRVLLGLKDFFADVIGCDFSLGLLKKLQNQNDKFKLLQADVENLPFKKGSFDLILSVRVIQHLRNKEQKKAISEMVGLLKKGGKLILMTYSARTLLGAYKKINMSGLYKIWPRWPLKNWNWVVDNYNTPAQLKKMFEDSGLHVTKVKGAVFGDPEILKALKISHFLEKYFNVPFKGYLNICRKMDNLINAVWPFRNLLGRILICGEKK